MNGQRVALPPFGFEAFGTASGLAIMAGALAAFAPVLSMLTATLVALAVAGWAALRHQEGVDRPTRSGAPATYVLPFSSLGAAGVLFLDPGSPLGRWRALVLALGLLPLWAVERLRSHHPVVLGRRG